MSNSDEKLVEAYMPKDPGLIARFLGVKRYKQKTMQKSIPGYKTALFCKAVDEIKKDYTNRVTFDWNYGSIVSPSYSNLEVGRDKHEELLISGCSLLIKDNSPLAVHISPGWGTMEMTIMYKGEDSEKALDFIRAVEKYMKDNNFYKNEKIDAAGKFLDIPDLDFDSLKLSEQNKKSIKVGALEFFKKKEIYQKNKLPFKRGLIFTGIPGTGKTHTGKILMNKSDCTFIWVNANMVSYTSDVKRLFAMAKELAPSILFMEDIDNYLEQRGSVDALKTQMDGMDSIDGICTILCTNHPDRLPKALIDRPSRFDDVILFKLPDADLRYQILMKIAEPIEIENKEGLLKELAEKTKGLTGAHLKEIVVYSLLLAADDDRENVIADDLAKAYLKVIDNKKRITEGLAEVDVKSFKIELQSYLKSKKENK